MKKIFAIKKSVLKIALIILLALVVIDIPITLMVYKSNANKKLLCEQMTEAIHKLPDYLEYIIDIAETKVPPRVMMDISIPSDMQYIFSQFNDEDWEEFLSGIPEDKGREIISIAEKFNLLKREKIKGAI